MNKLFYYRSTRTHAYFVKGQGFTTSCKTSASKLTEQEIASVKVAGFEPGYVEAVVSSFAVNYVRGQDLSGNQVKPNTNNPSKRRFATFDEAFQHGTRLRQRESSKDHRGFYVTETSDPVNASINWKTGLTNSI